MMEISRNWYGGMELRDYLCEERNKYAANMYFAIHEGEDGLLDAGAWEALNEIISHLDTKTSAVGAIATDEEDNSSK